MRYGKLIGDARTGKGWTIAQLARTSDVDRALVSRIESGRRRGSVDTLKKLVRALDLDLDRALRSFAVAEVTQ